MRGKGKGIWKLFFVVVLVLHFCVDLVGYFTIVSSILGKVSFSI